MSKVEDRICEKIQQRAKRGFKKYRVTMEREDLTTIQWLTHLQEELMDAVVYLEKLIAGDESLTDKASSWRPLFGKTRWGMPQWSLFPTTSHSEEE